MLKMYILLKDDLDPSWAPLVAAHASLSAYLRMQNSLDMIIWSEASFMKVICKVNQKEFDTAKTFKDVTVITESALDNKEVAIVLCPREEYPKPVKFYKLWK